MKKPKIISPDGSTLEEWCNRVRRIRDTESITDEFKIINDTDYYLTNIRIVADADIGIEQPPNVPPHSEAKLLLTFNGKTLFDTKQEDVLTNIDAELHVKNPNTSI